MGYRDKQHNLYASEEDGIIIDLDTEKAYKACDEYAIKCPLKGFFAGWDPSLNQIWVQDVNQARRFDYSDVGFQAEIFMRDELLSQGKYSQLESVLVNNFSTSLQSLKDSKLIKQRELVQ